MTALSEVLERLRRVRLPPGAAAGAVAVPSAGDELSREVSFLFAQLDEIDLQVERRVSSGASEAVEIEAAAGVEHRRILEDAHAQAEHVAAELLAERHARCEQRVREMLAEAEQVADGVLASGRERTPAFVREVVKRVVGGGR